MKAILICISSLAPLVLWVILGVMFNMGAAYYVVLAVLSAVDVMKAAVSINDRLRYIRYHKEDFK